MEQSEAYMTPLRPHLVCAYHAWILENGLIPYLWVDATHRGVKVPREYVKEGTITLNLSPMTLLALGLGIGEVRCQALFSGQPHSLVIPMMSVLGIYAKGNREGVFFTGPERRILNPVSGRVGFTRPAQGPGCGISVPGPADDAPAGGIRLL